VVCGHIKQAPRHSLVIDIEATESYSKIQIKGQPKDLSMSGCGLVSIRRFSKGTNVTIKLSRQCTQANALARVAYDNADLGMGFAFTHIEHGDKRVLEG
jgi:hypothetical protein